MARQVVPPSPSRLSRTSALSNVAGVATQSWTAHHVQTSAAAIPVTVTPPAAKGRAKSIRQPAPNLFESFPFGLPMAKGFQWKSHWRSDVEQEVADVAVLHNVRLALDAEFAGFADRFFALVLVEVVDRVSFAANEAPF